MEMSTGLKVLLLIGRFDVGGIQRQVMATASGLAERGHHIRVLCVYPTGRLAEELRAAGVDVQSLNRTSRKDIRSLLVGIRTVRAFGPDVLYCYHVLPNLVGLLYKPFIRRAKVIWGLRATDLERHGLVKRTQFRVSRLFARLPDAIVANSDAVRQFHVRAGYPREAIVVIPNGIDTRRFAPDPEGRARVREELGIEDQTFVVGVVAQLRDKKGHREFLEALAAVMEEEKDLVALMVGDGPQRVWLERATQRLDLADTVNWLGFRRDMPALYNALDLVCLPSTFGEGFPNVIGESLACGVPVVATDVGASKEIVGRFGAIVEAANPAALARGIRWAVRERAAGTLAWPLAAASARIDEEFSTGRLIDRTEQLMQELADAG